MSALLQSSRVTPDSRRGVHPDTQLCLVLVSAGLSALATMSPAARAAIVATLDDAVCTGHFPMGEHADAITRLRDHINVEGDPEAAKLRRLQEALISSALRAESDAQQLGDDQAPSARQLRLT